MAAIAALEALKRRARVELTPTANMCSNGITNWIHGWKKQRLADRRQEAGQERRSVAARSTRRSRAHEVNWHWVSGHAGHDLNERADQLARDAIAEGRAWA